MAAVGVVELDMFSASSLAFLRPPKLLLSKPNSPEPVPVGRCQPAGQMSPEVVTSLPVLYLPLPAVAEYQL